MQLHLTKKNGSNSRSREQKPKTFDKAVAQRQDEAYTSIQLSPTFPELPVKIEKTARKNYATDCA